VVAKGRKPIVEEKGKCQMAISVLFPDSSKIAKSSLGKSSTSRLRQSTRTINFLKIKP
jgi:hypothetical protein